jgi:multidrug transporter EmrE-like cation transporter
MNLLVIFLIGILHDAIWALYFRFAAEGKSVAAGITSVVITVMSFTIFAWLMHDISAGDYYTLAAYAIGGGLGTTGIVWIREKQKTLGT